ncbi:(Fe-S)-binding protein [Parapedobacter indicus]|uniref:4Fe-4S dicluster domain-containing protein n=1 Tax=Parapedobacter indicus TaxID=1477437 RepID=A0A1I3EV39_9SPHI|nr:(Fe-S)-binding protein [Parapedobacter indicus]PPL03425.1 4Fe-4S dicluster protein [Parapedobacter indicus]SFI02808.1 4Fe-4S dicluster domain-containing protein [Parapedobacter indicus]
MTPPVISQLIFAVLFVAALALAIFNARKIIQNIRLGRSEQRADQTGKRLQTMLLVAFGQKKMFKRPFAALLHLFVYLGFCIINLEMLEIVIDGLFGTHRAFSGLGGFYSFLIGAFEWLALSVLVGCVIFLTRRNITRVRRFFGIEMTPWPRTDANLILTAEILLMAAFLTMNAADHKLQLLGAPHYTQAGAFPISSWLLSALPDSIPSLIGIERFSWWFHIIGVLIFLNYLPYSKHLHILLAFPNTYFSNLHPKGRFTNMDSVTNEVKAMLDPSYTLETTAAPLRFGAKDIQDLTWKNLLEAYTCTECGRCTSVCPANITGKLLSPRKIMMDTRDRMVEVGDNIRKNKEDKDDGKSLLDNYITREEIWACTTCNACVEACPVNINPLEIIVELRRYAVMEESQAPIPLNAMFGNVENNGAPWKYAQADRANWVDD